MSSLPSVSVFGLGIIGSRCADNLETEGYQVTRWNRSKGKHSKQVGSPQDAASSDVLCLYLKDGVACRQVFTSIAGQLTSEQTLLNHSTIDLETTQWLATECAKREIPFLDCPFTGSKDAATGGNLVYYVGGDSKCLAQQENLLKLTSKEIHHLGKIGDATVIKIATNLISASTVQALSEAMAIGSAHGISPELLTQAVSSNACGSFLSQHG